MATDKIKVAVRVRPFNRRGLYQFEQFYSFNSLLLFIIIKRSVEQYQTVCPSVIFEIHDNMKMINTI